MFFKRKPEGPRKLAQQALGEVRRLEAIQYPLALLIEKGMQGQGVERIPGESWPEAAARQLGLADVGQLVGMLRAMVDKGITIGASGPATVNTFRGIAALLVVAEQDLASRSAEQPQRVG